MGGYGQHAYGGFSGGTGFTVGKILEFLGALFIFIAPLFHWLSMSVKYDSEKEKEAANMFKLASDDYLDKGVFIFFGVMIMIIGLSLLFLACQICMD